MISIAIPVYNMPNKDFFLDRCLQSIKKQTFTDYEIVITEEAGMASNINAAIKTSKGDIIKILFMDDFFIHEDSLKMTVDAFTGGWLVTGCLHKMEDEPGLFNPHLARWTDDITTGNNRIGSPSVITIENKDPILFDEGMTWLLDCDYYKRLHDRYGPPTILDLYTVAIGIHPGQATNLLTQEHKLQEYEYLDEKYTTI